MNVELHIPLTVEGITNLELKLMHGGHSDFTTQKNPRSRRIRYVLLYFILTYLLLFLGILMPIVILFMVMF